LEIVAFCSANRKNYFAPQPGIQTNNNEVTVADLADVLTSEDEELDENHEVVAGSSQAVRRLRSWCRGPLQ